MEFPVPPAARRPRHRRLRLLIGLVVALAATPAIVLASHQFSDVPTGHPFHGEIDALVDAGITNGCSVTAYCPNSAVSRGQMAAFLSRGLGTAAAGYGEISVADWQTEYVAGVTVSAGGVPGGTGFVTVTADISVFVFDPLLCPCGVEIGIDQLDGPGTSPQTVFIVPADTFEETSANSGTIGWVFEVPSGEDAEFAAYANVFTEGVEPLGGSTNGDVDPGVIFGSMTAEYSPFGSVTVIPPTKTLDERFGERPAAQPERSLPR